MATSHKTKQYLLETVKVLLVAITFAYIFYRLQNNPQLSLNNFLQSLYSQGAVARYSFLLFLLLAATNWAMEILKWKILVSSFEKISFFTALKQSLAALTISLATPNRIGEYGAKALFFKSEERKRILLLNLFSNIAQLLSTFLFGLTGLFYINYNYNLPYSSNTGLMFGLGLILVVTMGFFFRDKEIFIKRLSLVNVLKSLRSIPNLIKLNVLLFSILRYMVFSSMFYGLLLLFGAQMPFVQALAFIFAMYFLVSIVPTIFLLDVIVRAGVAVWLFSYAQVPELVVLSAVLGMYILNFVIPALLGSVFVFTYQPVAK